MHRRENFLPFFLVFFSLSLTLVLVGRSGILDDFASFFSNSLTPARNLVNVLTLKSLQNKVIKNLATENAILRKKLQNEKAILDENNALKSQFAMSPTTSQDLLPAKVIGEPGFVPGVTLPEYLIIDKGEKSEIENGDAVIFNNYLVGKIIKVYPDFSKVELITNKNSSFTARTNASFEIVGILKGQGGGEMTLDNVLLTTELKKDEDILTKGDKAEDGNGYPPDISVGRIISIEKKQSDLFQKGKIKSPIDFKNLDIVFVMR